MKKLLIMLLVPMLAHAGPFAELGLSVRESHTPEKPYIEADWRTMQATWVNYSPYDTQTKNPYANHR